jgi:hypothetical protein
VKRLISLAICLVSVIVLSAISSNAQCIECPKDSPPKRRPKPSFITRTQTVIVVKKVPEVRFQKISGIAITTVQPFAAVNLKSLSSQKQYQQQKKTDEIGVLELQNVPPGKYLLNVSLKGFVTEEAEIEVKPQELVTVPVNLAPITHDVFIKTNLSSGEVRYAQIEKPGESGGGYCMVPINRDGSAAIMQMREGDYQLEIRPGDVEYKPISRKLTISEEDLKKIKNADDEIPFKLDRTVSTEDFLANWLPNEWKMPAGWKLENKRMQTNSAGVALLQNERFNHYRNFQLKSNLRSLDNKSMGFVLRAIDDKNYYLIQINGSAAAEPYFLTGYIVKDGKVKDVLVNTNIKSFASSFSNSKFFNITITAKDNVFKISLEDTDTGAVYDIGIVEDQNNTFPIGAIGIGTKDSARFEVSNFFINYK